MRTTTVALIFLLAGLAGHADAQINVGSDGSDGAFAFVADAGDPNVMTIDLGLATTATWTTPSPVAGLGVYDPTEWVVVFKFTNVTVPAGKLVRFSNHPTRAPVVWLSQGDVVIDGEVDLDGADGHHNADTPTWAEPGPGGFRGGRGKLSGSAELGTAGFGPGGAFAHSEHAHGSAAGHARDGLLEHWASLPGLAYGASEIPRLIGGSGGGGNRNPSMNEISGSGAGGGAMLIAAETTVRVTGALHANGGGDGGWSGGQTKIGGDGSGGSIRLVGDVVVVTSAALLRCLGSYYASPGRIRIEANTHVLETPTVPLAHLGRPSAVIPGATEPTVRIVSIDGLPVPSDPTAALDNLYADVLTTGNGVKNVVIRGMHAPDLTPVELRLTDSRGDAVLYTGTLSAAGQPANQTEATIAVTFPASIVTLQARALLP